MKEIEERHNRYQSWKKRNSIEVIKDIALGCIGSLVIIALFVILGCDVEKPKPKEVPKMPEVIKVVPVPTPPAPVKKAIPVITKVKREGNTYTVRVNKATLKNKANLKVRLQVGYCVYEGVSQGDTVKITPEWTPPEGKIFVGVWDTQASKYVSSMRVG